MEKNLTAKNILNLKLYWILLESKSTTIISESRWENLYPLLKEDKSMWEEIYKRVCQITIEMKLQSFQ